jgi:hypothetical protein
MPLYLSLTAVVARESGGVAALGFAYPSRPAVAARGKARAPQRHSLLLRPVLFLRPSGFSSSASSGSSMELVSMAAEAGKAFWSDSLELLSTCSVALMLR